MHKKRIFMCLALLATLLVVNLVMVQSASSGDLTYTLNTEGTGYIVSACKSTASGSLSIPETHEGKPVVEIGRDAFLNCTGLTSVTIPTSVKTIGWYAFSGCTGLTSISIPDNVTTIDWFAFSNCTGLTSVTIGNGVTCIDASAFAGCTNLTTVTVGTGVASIGWSAFKGCTKLSSINIPGSVTAIDRYAFYNCNSLSSVTFCGTMEAWSAVTKGDGNDSLTGITPTFHNYVNNVCTICQQTNGCLHGTTTTVTENNNAATCTADGSYESVVYCSSCGKEMSRTTVSVPATGHEMVNGLCRVCKTEPYARGNIDGNDAVDPNDAIYLLLHTMYASEYPLNYAAADVNGDDIVNLDDAVYLLLHTMFGGVSYPLAGPAEH